jgi:hypothetical protein
MILFAALGSTVHGQDLLLQTWQSSWSPYRVIDDAGIERRLAKATIEFKDATTAGWSLAVRDADGQALDVEPIPPGKKGIWAHGFWIPHQAATMPKYILELRNLNRVVATRTVMIAYTAEPLVDLPLRLDRLDRGLLRRLEAREGVSAPDTLPDVLPYLRQHDIIYQAPSPGWDEGLPLGNGDVGALVTGVQGKEQVFYLDKTDIWLATAGEEPLGRSFAGTLRVRYSGRPNPDSFRQRLSLGSAEVITQDGTFRSIARVHASRNRFELDIYAPEVEIALERQPVTLWTDRKGSYANASRLFGSWASGLTKADYEAMREEALRAPHTKVEWGRQRTGCWFSNIAPNLRYSVALEVSGATVVWNQAGAGCVAKVRATGRGPIRLRAGVATSRESQDPLALAGEQLTGSDEKAHLDWWRKFWRRSWIELPDKLEENLWYLGVYQQAACSRSDQAVSFFGLWHPLDHRTWYDAYAYDAQVQMMWWLPFGSNHLELLYPSHRTFGRWVVEMVEHTPGAGMLISGLVPEWAGGHAYFGGVNAFKGTSAWYTMNFWWDFLYSGDRQFLRDVTYPMMRMVADFYVKDLVKGSDGRYHCVQSSSPEQLNTDRDNIFDWAMLNWFFSTIIRASEILQVDEAERGKWRDIQAHLFLPPGDGNTLWETSTNSHPYRCHPVVFYGLYPTGILTPGSTQFEAARRTVAVVTKLIGYRYQDRHSTIPAFEGGLEPNGHSSGSLLVFLARLGEYSQYRRFFYGLIVRFHMKQNGLRSQTDIRHSDQVARASLVEAANADTTATTETLLQSWDDHVRLFPCRETKGRIRFAGLRAAGGFVISAEAENGLVKWARIQSLVGGPLQLTLPAKQALIVRDASSHAEVPVRRFLTADGRSGLEVSCPRGAVYELRAGESVTIDLKPALAAERNQPRRISIFEAENQGERLNHYPETLPFGQVVRDGNLYLGRPRRYGSPPHAPQVLTLLEQAKSGRWQDRQEAARLLAKAAPDSRVLGALDRLCADQVSVVAHTAAVSLVHIQSPEGLRIAQAHAARDTVPGLRREVEKALGRLRQYVYSGL